MLLISDVHIYQKWSQHDANCKQIKKLLLVIEEGITSLFVQSAYISLSALEDLTAVWLRFLRLSYFSIKLIALVKL